jgi:hypothetical protein
MTKSYLNRLSPYDGRRVSGLVAAAVTVDRMEYYGRHPIQDPDDGMAESVEDGPVHVDANLLHCWPR